MKQVTIYTDGACSGNPGPGGWGAILMYGAHKRELSGGEADTTNNRMELTAVIRALSLLKEPCIVELWSDSKYVIDGLSKGWAKGWKAKGWVKSDKKPALNPDLWDELLRLESIHTLRYHWVKGHAENEFNNRCDETGGRREPQIPVRTVFLPVFAGICGKCSRKVEKGPERLQIVHSKHIISQKCSGILILAKGPPNPMRFLPPKTHSKNPSPSGEGFLCFLTCNSPSHPSGPWAGRCDTPASAGI